MPFLLVAVLEVSVSCLYQQPGQHTYLWIQELYTSFCMSPRKQLNLDCSITQSPTNLCLPPINLWPLKIMWLWVAFNYPAPAIRDVDHQLTNLHVACLSGMKLCWICIPLILLLWVQRVEGSTPSAKVHDLEHSIHKRLRSPLRPVWFRLGASVMFFMQEGITWVLMCMQLSLCSCTCTMWKHFGFTHISGDPSCLEPPVWVSFPPQNQPVSQF